MSIPAYTCHLLITALETFCILLFARLPEYINERKTTYAENPRSAADEVR